MTTRTRSGGFAQKKAKLSEINKCRKNMDKWFIEQFKIVLANFEQPDSWSIEDYKDYLDRVFFKGACDLYDILNNETISNSDTTTKEG